MLIQPFFKENLPLQKAIIWSTQIMPMYTLLKEIMTMQMSRFYPQIRSFFNSAQNRQSETI